MTRATGVFDIASWFHRLAIGLVIAFACLGSMSVLVPSADAQDIDAILRDLENQGWFIETGAEGSSADFDRLARSSSSSPSDWYFVSLNGSVEGDFADLLRDDVRPTGNVIVYFVDADGFIHVQLASDASEAIEDQALAPFDDDWTTPDEFMADVVTDFDRLVEPAASASSGSTSSAATESSGSGGGGGGWLWFAVPISLIVGGIWFAGRRSKKRAEADALDAATKLTAQIQEQLDELANDVLVLSGPVDLTDKEEAITHYRQATAVYTAISDEIPDLEQLETAEFSQLAELGARVAHARWQMDAAEAIIDGEPVPEQPKVEPPPPPPEPETPAAEPRVRLPKRDPRPRTSYSRSRSSGGGGLLDVLIAGAGSRNRRGSSNRRRSSGPRPGGGVFGGGSSSRRSSRRSTSRSRPSRSRSRSRRSSSRSRSSSSRRSTSRSRRR